MRYLISVQYDGSKFYGFQRLKNENSVQKKLETALSIINKKEVLIKGAGRTDRGVHALDQKATFDLDYDIDEAHLNLAINSLVKPYIYVTKVKKVADTFHARFNTLRKEYIYKINLGKYNPLRVDYELQYNKPLNISKMQECAQLFIGIHNFKNFVSGTRDSYDCIIYNIELQEKNELLEIKFEGKSFYRYMVRNLVGAMLDYATNKKDLSEIKYALEFPHVEKQFSTALPVGLYLNKIEYEE